MLDTVHRYLEATIGVAIMAMFGIISGFVAYGLTGERTLAFVAAGAGFALTGVVLTVRLWLITRRPVLPPDSAS